MRFIFCLSETQIHGTLPPTFQVMPNNTLEYLSFEFLDFVTLACILQTLAYNKSLVIPDRVDLYVTKHMVDDSELLISDWFKKIK